MNSASARASSVLPTPVGPRNRNVPIGRSGSCLVLTDDAFVQALLHVDQLLGFALEQAADGDTGPARDDLGDVVGVDLLFQEQSPSRPTRFARSRLGGVLAGFALGQLAFELGDVLVEQLGGALEVGFALRALGVDARLLELNL
jgi:hypothetical protein